MDDDEVVCLTPVTPTASASAEGVSSSQVNLVWAGSSSDASTSADVLLHSGTSTSSQLAEQLLSTPIVLRSLGSGRVFAAVTPSTTNGELMHCLQPTNKEGSSLSKSSPPEVHPKNDLAVSSSSVGKHNGLGTGSGFGRLLAVPGVTTSASSASSSSSAALLAGRVSLKRPQLENGGISGPSTTSSNSHPIQNLSTEEFMKRLNSLGGGQPAAKPSHLAANRITLPSFPRPNSQLSLKQPLQQRPSTSASSSLEAGSSSQALTPAEVERLRHWRHYKEYHCERKRREAALRNRQKTLQAKRHQFQQALEAQRRLEVQQRFNSMPAGNGAFEELVEKEMVVVEKEQEQEEEENKMEVEVEEMMVLPEVEVEIEEEEEDKENPEEVTPEKEVLDATEKEEEEVRVTEYILPRNSMSAGKQLTSNDHFPPIRTKLHLNRSTSKSEAAKLRSQQEQSLLKSSAGSSASLQTQSNSILLPGGSAAQSWSTSKDSFDQQTEQEEQQLVERKEQLKLQQSIIDRVMQDRPGQQNPFVATEEISSTSSALASLLAASPTVTHYGPPPKDWQPPLPPEEEVKRVVESEQKLPVEAELASTEVEMPASHLVPQTASSSAAAALQTSFSSSLTARPIGTSAGGNYLRRRQASSSVVTSRRRSAASNQAPNRSLTVWQRLHLAAIGAPVEELGLEHIRRQVDIGPRVAPFPPVPLTASQIGHRQQLAFSRRRAEVLKRQQQTIVSGRKRRRRVVAEPTEAVILEDQDQDQEKEEEKKIFEEEKVLQKPLRRLKRATAPRVVSPESDLVGGVKRFRTSAQTEVKKEEVKEEEEEEMKIEEAIGEDQNNEQLKSSPEQASRRSELKSSPKASCSSAEELLPDLLKDEVKSEDNSKTSSFKDSPKQSTSSTKSTSTPSPTKKADPILLKIDPPFTLISRANPHLPPISSIEELANVPEEQLAGPRLSLIRSKATLEHFTDQALATLTPAAEARLRPKAEALRRRVAQKAKDLAKFICYPECDRASASDVSQHDMSRFRRKMTIPASYAKSIEPCCISLLPLEEEEEVEVKEDAPEEEEEEKKDAVKEDLDADLDPFQQQQAETTFVRDGRKFARRKVWYLWVGRGFERRFERGLLEMLERFKESGCNFVPRILEDPRWAAYREKKGRQWIDEGKREKVHQKWERSERRRKNQPRPNFEDLEDNDEEEEEDEEEEDEDSEESEDSDVEVEEEEEEEEEDDDSEDDDEDDDSSSFTSEEDLEEVGISVATTSTSSAVA